MTADRLPAAAIRGELYTGAAGWASFTAGRAPSRPAGKIRPAAVNEQKGTLVNRGASNSQGATVNNGPRTRLRDWQQTLLHATQTDRWKLDGLQPLQAAL